MKPTNNVTRVLVAGSTGVLGGEICRQLRAQNKPVRGLVRTTSDEVKPAALKDAGVELAIGDLYDKASLQKALVGITTVISTVSSTFSRQDGDSLQTVDEEGQLNLVDAAVAAGVSKFVYVSFCEMPGDFPLQNSKRKVEQHLRASGINFTILQPTCFTEIWLSPALGFDFVNAKATIYGEGKGKVSWIAVKDVAAFAVAAIDNPAAMNQTIPLGGPEALSQLEVVNIFQKLMNKKFELQQVPMDALKAQEAAATDPMAKSFAALTAAVAAGSEIDMTNIPAGFPTRLTAVEEYAKRLSE
jgi:NADH dehydrogenase